MSGVFLDIGFMFADYGDEEDRAWLRSLGFVIPEPDEPPDTRWPECPGCVAGVKHIHCRHPWQDEGGGG